MSFTSLTTNFLIISYLPTLVQHFLHQLHPYIYKPGQIPYPGQHKYYRNYVLCFFFLSIAYISYNLYQVYLGLEYNHYESKIIKKTFNQYSLHYHPDKNPQYEQVYLRLSKSYEILKNPAKKYIYDVIGETGLMCKDCKVIQKYITSHLNNIFIFYSSTLFFLGAYIFLGFQSHFYWKFILLALLFWLEISVLVGKVNFNLLQQLFPSKTPYEFTLYFRQLVFDLIYLTSHIANLILPNPDTQQTRLLQNCEQLTKNIGVRVSSVFQSQIIQSPAQSHEKLFSWLKKWQEIELMTSDKQFQNALTNYSKEKANQSNNE
ncbi:hypothetical protein CONCODRAFT_80569 [Conidiobolus coronatus NRRL 28638]|uniref:J domain-containing protein n=1 Tax=Conidiobolus coronatus (strain ATCC 28846 / CBS 209.66 / NRRL 28638) TaxID=796925 RepID=A0A137NTY1_CONC2|nr:hypothetical protein CONCODRAFT_80569 [Conidiobolus coronatus NRRL 28638]|eukprot:KXN66186.1 hypothetical protein CONCODRAFT_80569 [Conidiobolus coronatus NRRL 28638]